MRVSEECVICLERPGEVRQLICEHVCMCFECYNIGVSLCPLCRSENHSIVIPAYPTARYIAERYHEITFYGGQHEWIWVFSTHDKNHIFEILHELYQLGIGSTVLFQDKLEDGYIRGNAKIFPIITEN